jgi:hypothetical protein
MSSDGDSRELADMIADVMRGSRPLTVRQIATAIERRSGVTTDPRTVTVVLIKNRRRFGLYRPRFFQRLAKWHLVEAGPADDPGNAGASVPAWPYRPTMSGSAAVPLAFREDDPPTNAMGPAV